MGYLSLSLMETAKYLTAFINYIGQQPD